MFIIKNADKNDMDTIMSMIKTALELQPNPSWFIADTKEYYASHIADHGFILKAMHQEEIAAFLIVRFPHFAEDNLGYSLEFEKEKLTHVAHIETAVVKPQYQGNRLEQRLIKEAMSRLENTQYTIYMATVHPDNIASAKSCFNLGFHSAKIMPKYGGHPRHIMLKERDC